MTTQSFLHPLSFRQVRFCYANVCALGNVTFDIPAQKLIALAGPNGGGKSTLIRLMAGLLKPESGLIERHQTIAYVPQSPGFDTSFPLTVREFVQMGTLEPAIRPFARYDTMQKDRTLKAIRQMGLSEFSTRAINQLSGGQLRRAMIARALASASDIIAMDEPDANLDMDATRELYAILNNLKVDKTIILASHHINEMLDIADQAFYVNHAVTVFQRPQELKLLLKNGMLI